MAKVTIQRVFPDGDCIVVSVAVRESFPDSVAEARQAARQAFADAHDVILADIIESGDGDDS